jgi:preprotein translocase subunit SecE
VERNLWRRIIIVIIIVIVPTIGIVSIDFGSNGPEIMPAWQ